MVIWTTLCCGTVSTKFIVVIVKTYAIIKENNEEEKTIIKKNGQIMFSCSDWIFMRKLTKKLRNKTKTILFWAFRGLQSVIKNFYMTFQKIMNFCELYYSATIASH